MAELSDGAVVLLENLRFDAREKKNDPTFCEELAAFGDLWYYLHPEGGSMVTGYKKIGGKMYLFADSGRMLTGWQRVNEKFPYL